MYKIAVMGDSDSVLGFKALGLDVYPVENVEQAKRTLHRLAKEDCAIVYMTEQLGAQIPEELARYKDAVMPAIILIPGKDGSLGIGQENVTQSVVRAVGADIL
jgi:V/A-type H+-transporting ATPase subunit F